MTIYSDYLSFLERELGKTNQNSKAKIAMDFIEELSEFLHTNSAIIHKFSTVKQEYLQQIQSFDVYNIPTRLINDELIYDLHDLNEILLRLQEETYELKVISPEAIQWKVQEMYDFHLSDGVRNIIEEARNLERSLRINAKKEEGISEFLTEHLPLLEKYPTIFSSFKNRMVPKDYYSSENNIFLGNLKLLDQHLIQLNGLDSQDISHLKIATYVETKYSFTELDELDKAIMGVEYFLESVEYYKKNILPKKGDLRIISSGSRDGISSDYQRIAQRILNESEAKNDLKTMKRIADDIRILQKNIKEDLSQRIESKSSNNLWILIVIGLIIGVIILSQII